MITSVEQLNIYKNLLHKNFIPEIKQFPTFKDKFVYKYQHNGFLNYKMFDKKGILIGTMQALPMRVDYSGFYPDMYTSYYSFYIRSLKAIKRYIGVGKSFIKIAKKESYRNNCDGKVHLVAANINDIKDKPDIFYRKCGFDSSDKYHIEEIDKCIKENKPLKNLWRHTLMYLPIDKLNFK